MKTAIARISYGITSLLPALFLLTFTSVSSLEGQVVGIGPTAVGRTKEVMIPVEFAETLRIKPDSSKYALLTGSGEKVYCSKVVAVNKRMRFFFQLNSANFVIFERLISDSTGYAIINFESVASDGDTIHSGDLVDETQGKIRRISESAWKKYILDEYASQYLFPHSLNVGTQLGAGDSTKTVYFLELVQSGSWISSEKISVFWGIKGRWSTDNQDVMNYTKFYPATILFNGSSSRFSLMAGVETGYLGFRKQGRGAVKGEFQFRLPFNPIDFTLGTPRWRINPVMVLSGQWNTGWSDVKVPDSLKSSFDVRAAIRYDIPVGKNYYLQTSVIGNYSTVTEKLDYSYEISLGYIANGEVRIMALYKQGYQEVTYQYDRKLLLGFAFDILNQSTVAD